MKKPLILLFVAIVCNCTLAFDRVSGFTPFQNSDTWVSEMRDYTVDYRNGKYLITLAQYRTQCYVSYDSGNPQYFYITRHDIADCCPSYRHVSGAKILVVTQTVANDTTLFQQSRRQGSFSSERESIDSFDALCSKLGIVNYIYHNVNIQNLLDIDTTSIGLTKKPIFGMFRLPSDYDNITDWKEYLRGHCITNEYPSSFINHNWEQSWKDLTQLATSVIASETVAENEKIISDVKSSTQTYYIHPENVIARFNVTVRDLLFNHFTSESDNDTVKQIEVLGGNVFVDHDDRICMKESSVDGVPMLRFVATRSGTFVAETYNNSFTAWTTISGTNSTMTATSIKLGMSNGDSVTFCGECVIDLFEFY